MVQKTQVVLPHLSDWAAQQAGGGQSVVPASRTGPRAIGTRAGRGLRVAQKQAGAWDARGTQARHAGVEQLGPAQVAQRWGQQCGIRPAVVRGQRGEQRLRAQRQTQHHAWQPRGKRQQTPGSAKAACCTQHPHLQLHPWPLSLGETERGGTRGARPCCGRDLGAGPVGGPKKEQSRRGGTWKGWGLRGAGPWGRGHTGLLVPVAVSERGRDWGGALRG